MSNIAYYMSIEKRLPNYLKSCDKHKKRENYCLKNSWNTTYSIKSYLENSDTMAELKSLNCTKLVQPAYDLLKSNMIPIASDAKWKDSPFGAASTLGKSGCMAFCTYNTLLLANLPYPPLLTFSEVTKLLVTHSAHCSVSHTPLNRQPLSQARKDNRSFVPPSANQFPTIANVRVHTNFLHRHISGKPTSIWRNSVLFLSISPAMTLFHPAQPSGM